MDIAIFAVFCAVALPIIVCAFIVFLFVFSRYKERMALIKQGIVPQSQPKPAPNKYIALRNGFICIGIALGITIGIVIDDMVDVTENISILIITASALFCLGASYLAFYLIIRNKDLDE